MCVWDTECCQVLRGSTGGATFVSMIAKLSVSLDHDDVLWARARARRLRGSLSGVLSQALKLARQQEARELFLKKHAKRVPSEPALAKIEAEWSA
jgi:hypothetical protein